MKTKKYRYTGKDFDIKTAPTKVKDSADDLKKIKKKIKKNVKSIKNAQKMMYARRHYGVLVVFQAMDAAGKDSMISHIFAGVNPVGFKVANFKQPTGRELRHDYLWRINRELPMRGDIGVFNRSYYEDVLVSRVHPALILQSNIPGIESVHDVNNKFFDSRYEDIRQYESYLTRNGYLIVKFFLHVSRGIACRRAAKSSHIPQFAETVHASDKFFGGILFPGYDFQAFFRPRFAHAQSLQIHAEASVRVRGTGQGDNTVVEKYPAYLNKLLPAFGNAASVFPEHFTVDKEYPNVFCKTKPVSSSVNGHLVVHSRQNPLYCPAAQIIVKPQDFP